MCGYCCNKAAVTQQDFGDPCANHSNSVLAGSNTFDNGYLHNVLHSRPARGSRRC